jgi:hypothetical protein
MGGSSTTVHSVSCSKQIAWSRRKDRNYEDFTAAYSSFIDQRTGHLKWLCTEDCHPAAFTRAGSSEADSGACADQTGPPTAAPTAEAAKPTAVPVAVAELKGDMIRGAKLYDSWWVEALQEDPTDNNPLWAKQTTNKAKGANT